MFGLRTKKDTSERVAELRAAVGKAEARLEAAQTELGDAIADGDERLATKARAAVTKHTAALGELQVALPAAERRATEADARAAEARRAKEAVQANEARLRRLAAAREVDAAWRSLARAFEALDSTEIGGTREDRMRVGRRSHHAHQAAAYLWAPELADRLDIPRVSQGHRRGLEDAESVSIREQEA